jgi:hypothetical protein
MGVCGDGEDGENDMVYRLTRNYDFQYDERRDDGMLGVVTVKATKSYYTALRDMIS